MAMIKGMRALGIGCRGNSECDFSKAAQIDQLMRTMQAGIS